ncbi:hypothetical protein UA08_07449 [Talaromyces atroroseus]|uniref:Mob1/phocein n=1 Tax=Talaromyces atroroseus TaxID=1441469 RepID=A0A225AV51_TALAT|nr:hypothetical protein UA08_07449 [Talaromyces atroroseus]OKL57357.1 hypothetical protein UA08_07449 [Talaromyces atroroseus]
MDMDFVLFDDPPGQDELELEDDFDFDCETQTDRNCPLFFSTIPPAAACSSSSSHKAFATTSVSRKMAATAGAVSPSSSPRLPSPPPFTEVQIGPQSPTVGDAAGNEQLFAPLAETDDGSTRRIRPGTKAADMASGLPLIPLSQLDSPFQLQEHLKALYHNYTMPAGSSTIHPITHDVAVALAQPPEGVERSLWLYELCRFLTMKVNNLIIAFFAEDPPCSQQSCPEMRASEWQYLCAVHDPPKSCCAIDYCCHTLDWATNILTSPKYFPSRLTLGSESAGGPQASMRHLTNIFRRLYRIFAHAWFQHRDVFRQVENTDGLYVFFKTVCDAYELIPPDNYTVPDEAEQSASAAEDNDDSDDSDDSPINPTPTAAISPENNRRISVLRKEPGGGMPSLSLEEPSSSLPAPSNISTGATTRRHKHSPSTGSSVTTIAEANEDNNALLAKNDQLPKVEENDNARSTPVVDAESALSAEQDKSPDEENEPEERQPEAAPAQEAKEEKAPEVLLEAIPDPDEQSSPTATVVEAAEQPTTSDQKLSNGESPVIIEAPFASGDSSSATVSVVETAAEKDE